MKVSSQGKHHDIVGDVMLIKQEQTFAENLSHLDIHERVKLEEYLYDEDILAWLLHDLRSAEVPFQHVPS